MDERSLWEIPVHVLDGFLILLGRPKGAGTDPFRESLLSFSRGGENTLVAEGDADLRYQAVVAGNVLNGCFSKVSHSILGDKT